MRRTVKTLIFVMLAIIFSQALSASGTDTGVADSTPQIQYWGNAIDGMQMGTSFTDVSFPESGVVELWLAMRNVSGRKHSIEISPIGQCYDVVLVDSYGKVVPLTKYGKSVSDDSVTAIKSEDLESGQSFLKMLPLSRIYNMSKPGVYFVVINHAERNTSKGAKWLNHTPGLMRIVIGDVKNAISSPQIRVLGDAMDGLEQESLSISISTKGDFGGKRYSWCLTMNPQRKAKLVIYAYHKRIVRFFTVSKSKIENLKRVIAKERFFELRDSYGENVLDSSVDTMRIVWRKKAKTVNILYLMNWVHSNPGKLQEPARAIRVFHVIRGWFNDPQAVDLRRYDKIVLDAADKQSQ